MLTFPFQTHRGEPVCFACGSHRDNEFWACPTCAPHKPVDPAAKDGRYDDGRLLTRAR